MAEPLHCPFCEIVARRAPATVLDDGHGSLIFAPLAPVTEGHALVVPKRHVRDAAEDPMVTAGVMAHAARWAQQHDAANIITSIGQPATQSVFHLHIHVVPRRHDDGLSLPWTDQSRSGGAR